LRSWPGPVPASAGDGEAVRGEGATIVYCARRKELLDSLAREIEVAGGKGKGVVLDVSDIGAYTGALEDTARTYGKLDIFVHNAMYGNFRMLADTDLDEWRANFGSMPTPPLPRRWPRSV